MRLAAAVPPVFAALPAPFNTSVDAVLSKHQGTSHEVHYIFSGEYVLEYILWPYAPSPVRAPPMRIGSHSIFGQLPAPFNAKIDAVISMDQLQ